MLFSLFKSSDSTDNKADHSFVTKGIFITLPIFGLILFLLTKADPAYERLVSSLLDNIWERLLVSSILFIGLLNSARTILSQTKSTDEPKTVRNEKIHELWIISGSLVALFATFIFVQFQYLFSGALESQLAQLGVKSLTYSEYVRKGFVELIIVSLITSAVIIYILRFLHQFKDRQKLSLQLLSGALITETMLLVFSAAQRVNLYQAAHGLTRIRIFGMIFLVWLLTILIILLVRSIKNLKNRALFFSSVSLTLLAFLAINLINVDGLIATKYRPHVNNETDYFYLTSISKDASASWIPTLKDSERIITQLEKSPKIGTEENRQLSWARYSLANLELHVSDLIDKYGPLSDVKSKYVDNKSDWVSALNTQSNSQIPRAVYESRNWQSFNLSQYQAYQLIRQNEATFKLLPQLVKRAADLDARVTNEVRSQTQLDRDTAPPLISQ